MSDDITYYFCMSRTIMFPSEFISQELITSAAELNHREDMVVEYHPYSDDWGYWTIDNVFKNFDDYVYLSSLSPCTPTYMPENMNNWFHKQYILSSQIQHYLQLLDDFNAEFVRKNIITLFHTSWANVFRPEKDHQYIVPKRITYPHTDSSLENNAVVSSIWLNEEENGGTSFWSWKGRLVAPVSTYDEYQEYVNTVIGNDPTPFVNHDTHGDWVKLAESPCNYSQVVVYTGAQYHSPTIADHSKTRWSHLIAGHPWS